MLITVPAFQWLWTGHDVINSHVRRYSAGECADTLAAGGLEVERISYLFQSLIVPKLAVRVIESVVGVSSDTPRVPPEWLNRLLGDWYSIEYTLAGSLPFGGSVMAIARRGDGRS